MKYTLNEINVSFLYEENEEKVFIDSPFQDKDEVKSWGARWSPDDKSWWLPKDVFEYLFFWFEPLYGYIEDYPPPKVFKEKTFAHTQCPLVFQLQENELGFDELIAVVAPFRFKDDLKSNGFQWNPAAKKWYSTEPEDVLLAMEDVLFEVPRHAESEEKSEDEDEEFSLFLDEVDDDTQEKVEKALSLLKKGIELYSFQRESVEYLLKHDYVLLTEQMGCIAGDMEVTILRSGCSRKMPLKKFFGKQADKV